MPIRASSRRNERGAALIIVAAIIVILGTIALSFFTMTRSESRTAFNVANMVRADHLVDSAFAIAIARLNQDLHQHPQASSTDHSWRTFFNGAWAVGKPWFMTNTGIPYLDMRPFEGIDIRLSDGTTEGLYKGTKTIQWLYIPRAEGNAIGIYDSNAVLVYGGVDQPWDNNNETTFAGIIFRRYNPDAPEAMPFVTADFYDPDQGYPAEQVNTWADVDLDGDGLKDSVWFPIGADVFRSNDGIDNNLNGVVDEQGEAVTYVYHGMGSFLDPEEGDFSRPGDGLDNDGINGVDDPGEDRLFLTAPILGTAIPVDINNDGILNEFDQVEDADGNCVQLTVVFPSFMTVLTSQQGPVPVSQGDVDALDNDFDLLANNYRARAYFNAGLGNKTGLKNLGLDATGVRADLTFYPSTDLCFPVVNVVSALDIEVAHSGEPECELMGRAAVYISDESSKVNLNVAGAETYHESFDPATAEGPMMRAIADGASPFEYDTRVLPDIGIAQASKLWGLLVGAPDGVHLPVDPDGQTLYLTPTPGSPNPANPLASYEYDLSFPGYGRVDDNSNALALAMNGIDDDGDGLVDEGLYLPNAVDLAITSDPALSLQAANTILGDPDHIRDPNIANTVLNAQQYDSLTGDDRIVILDYVRYQDYFERLALFEGIDEPAELQRFSPLRNLVAEGVVGDNTGDFDLLDNDDDGSLNQPGELGDRQLQNLKQIMDADNVGQGTYDSLKNLTTVFSTERGVNAFKNDEGKLVAFNKLNPDLATPQQTAAKLMLDNDFAPVTNNFGIMAPFGAANDTRNDVDLLADVERAQRFAIGLRQGAIGLTAPTTNGTPDLELGADGQLLDDLLFGGGILHIPDPNDPAELIPTTNPYNEHAFPIDPQLEAMQLAVDLADNRDDDHERSVLTTEPFDTVDELLPDGSGLESGVKDPWPLAEDLNDRERLKASGNSLLPLEEIQDFASSTLHLTRNLEIVDEWWSEFVTGNNGQPEERHISYTAAGQEAVRINEIMVRPVRRVEAEMTSPGDIDYSLNFDPARVAGMLLFDVQRETLSNRFSEGEDWVTEGLILGETAGMRTSGGLTAVPGTDPDTGEDTDYPVPDILQYSIVASDGLPEGNYYLTLNVTDSTGTRTVGGPGELAYAIKYVLDGAPDIIDDVGLILTGENPEDIATYWDANWVSCGWYGSPTAFDCVANQSQYFADTLGEPLGWMFLDGTPKDLLEPNPDRIPGYYGQEIGEVVEYPGEIVNFQVDCPISCGGARGWSQPEDDGLIHTYVWLKNSMLNVASIQSIEGSIVIPGIDSVTLAVPLPDLVGNPVGPWLLELPAVDPLTPVDVDPDTEELIFFGDLWRTGQVAVELTFTMTFGPTPITISGLISNRSIYRDGLTDSQFRHTVYVPGAGWHLCIAFAVDPSLAGAGELSINFMDFSQEPDHEYVELVNVSDKEVNIGGWTLEVGIPAVQSDDSTDPYRTRWVVPNPDDGIWIAPGGMVLLGFDRFDNSRTLPGLLGGPDSDLDEIPDAWELTHGMDPEDDGSTNIDNGAIGDIDGDGIINFSAYLMDIRGPLVNGNGMGLASSDTTDGILTSGNDILNMSVPPMEDTSSKIVVDSTDPLYIENLVPLYDPTGSVFERLDIPYKGVAAGQEYLTAYVDRDGDGFTSAYLNDAQLAVYGDTDNVRAESRVPWDRIIMLTERVDDMGSRWGIDDPSLEIPRLQDANTVEALAHWVLRGGVFPNYPERDRIDNDGDGAYLREIPDAEEEESWEYVPGTLDKDMVDNDLDNLIDEGSIFLQDGVDNDSDGFIDELDEKDILPEESEGVDEGAMLPLVAGRAFDAGSFESDTLPVSFVNDRGEYEENLIPDARLDLALGAPRGIDALTAANITSIDDPYLGSDVDPPDWKAFAERRWYPGDNVIVTLYDGDPPVAGVVDRVTYRELDVTNRTVDDIEGWPYTGGELNLDYPTFWSPDQMGLDFYRSLERKHPLYSGDRFGTSNRWEATDGNYDDWADSLSVFAVSKDGGVARDIGVALDTVPPVLVMRELDPNNGTDLEKARLADSARLLGHCLWGSPLRMNLAQRLSENPKDLGVLFDPANETDGVINAGELRYGARADRQFAASSSMNLDENPNISYSAILGFPDNTANTDWTHGPSTVKDAAMGSTGELALLAHLTFRHVMFNTSGTDPFLFDITHLNMAVGYELDNNYADMETFNTYSRQDLSNRGAVLGASASKAFLAAATDMISTDVLTLTVGQADFTPIVPLPVDVPDYAGEINFSSGEMPRMWAPVFLLQLSANESYDLTFNSGGQIAAVTPDISYLFNSALLLDLGNPVGLAFLGGSGTNLTRPALAARWPLLSRAVMYLSQSAGEQAEALFAWDAADGLENGEYAAYVRVERPQTARAMQKAGFAEPDVWTPFAADLCEKFAGPLTPGDQINPDPFWDLRQIRLGLEFITDRANASKAALQEQLLQGPWNPGVFAPGEDGVIFYGNQGGFAQRGVSAGWLAVPVNVTENFLALRVRNMGEDGSVAAITQVILAPRKRTTGKINLNTAETRLVDDRIYDIANDSMTNQIGKGLFNPLLGLPGVADALSTMRPRETDAIRVDPTRTLLDVAVGQPIEPTDNIAARGVDWLGGAWPSPDVFWADFGLGFPDAPNIFRADLDLPYGSNPLSFIPDTYRDDPNGPKIQDEIAAVRLSELIMLSRPQHVDGRYYTSMADLVGSAPDPENPVVTPLSNESEPSHWFGEVYERLRRMSNSVTFRGDVFEIVVKVQTGYLVDADADGRLNYRSNQDFNVTGEMPGRMVYERRTPTDRAGEGLGR